MNISLKDSNTQAILRWITKEEDEPWDLHQTPTEAQNDAQYLDNDDRYIGPKDWI
jgi:hypothetical protein